MSDYFHNNNNNHLSQHQQQQQQFQQVQQKVQLKKSTKRSKSRGGNNKNKNKSKLSKLSKSNSKNNLYSNNNTNNNTNDKQTIKQSLSSDNDNIQITADQEFKIHNNNNNNNKKYTMMTSVTISAKKPRSQHAAQGTIKQGNNNNNNKASSQRQVKLNYFLKKGQINKNINTTTSNNINITNNKNQSATSKHITASITTSSIYAITQNQRKHSSLQKHLKQKQQILQRMKLDRQIHTQRYNKLKIQSQQYKLKCRQTMEKQLTEYGRLRRQQKAQINPKYGYYRQAGWTVFIQGESLLRSKRTLNELTNKIQQLQKIKYTCLIDQRQSITSQIDHLSKVLNQHKQQMKRLQSQVAQYKQKLRLADKQQSCTIARNNWSVIENRYLPLQLLGSGGFGEVYKAYDLQLNTHIAIKVNCFQPTKNRQQFIRHVQRQVATLKELHHPNIVKLIDEILIDNKISFVLEYCKGPQLSKYLIKNQFLSQHQARAIIKQISFALRYMYNQRHRVIHYDLKPANIMFHNGCVKILDFGLCKKMQTQDTKIDLTSQGVGTYWYLPPQTFMDSAQVSPKVDVWSLGVIFYQLLYGRRPFGHGIGQNKIYQQGIILKASKVEFPTDKKYKVSEAAKQFIRDCLRYDPDERLDPQQVYQHQYLRK